MQPSDQLQYSMLRKCCGEFDQLTSTMMQAKNNINILEFILKTSNVPEEQKNTFLKGYIDELIASPNQAEKEVYDEIAYNELVIKLEEMLPLQRNSSMLNKPKKLMIEPYC